MSMPNATVRAPRPLRSMPGHAMAMGMTIITTTGTTRPVRPVVLA